ISPEHPLLSPNGLQLSRAHFQGEERLPSQQLQAVSLPERSSPASSQFSPAPPGKVSPPASGHCPFPYPHRRLGRSCTEAGLSPPRGGPAVSAEQPAPPPAREGPPRGHRQSSSGFPTR